MAAGTRASFRQEWGDRPANQSRRLLQSLARPVLQNLIQRSTTQKCQPFPASLVGPGQQFLVEPHLLQDGRVQVPKVTGTFHRPQADGIGGPHHPLPLNAPARQPHRESEVVVIAPAPGLHFGRPPKLPTRGAIRFQTPHTFQGDPRGAGSSHWTSAIPPSKSSAGAPVVLHFDMRSSPSWWWNAAVLLFHFPTFSLRLDRGRGQHTVVLVCSSQVLLQVAMVGLPDGIEFVVDEVDGADGQSQDRPTGNLGQYFGPGEPEFWVSFFSPNWSQVIERRSRSAVPAAVRSIGGLRCFRWSRPLPVPRLPIVGLSVNAPPVHRQSADDDRDQFTVSVPPVFRSLIESPVKFQNQSRPRPPISLSSIDELSVSTVTGFSLNGRLSPTPPARFPMRSV